MKSQSRRNGHKINCKCPICKNIKKSQSRRNKNKKGGNLNENINLNGENNVINSDLTKNEIPANDKDYEDLDMGESGNIKLIGGKQKKKYLSRKISRRKKTKRNNKKNRTYKRK